MDYKCSILAARRSLIANLDFALLNIQSLLDLNIKIVPTKGDTYDEKVNLWHRDLVELIASKIFDLAKLIMIKAESRRIQEKDIGKFVMKAITSGQIDPARLEVAFMERLRKVVAKIGNS